MSREQTRTARLLPVVLLVVGGLLLLGALGAGFVRDTVLDADEFADRGASALDEEAVRDELANAVVTRLTDASPNLLAVRPLLVATAESVIDSDVVKNIVRVGMRELQQELIGGQADRLTVRVADLLLLVNAQVQVLAPELASEVPDGATDGLLDITSGGPFVGVVEIADKVRLLAFALPLLALLAFGATVVLDRRGRRQRLVHVGITIAVVGVIVVLGEAIGRMAIDRFAQRDAAVSLWDVFIGDLSDWGLMVFAVGSIVGLGASAALQPRSHARLVERARSAIVVEPETARGRYVRLIGAVVLGTWLVVDAPSLLRVVAAIAGLLLLASVAARAVEAIVAEPAEDGDGGSEPQVRVGGAVAVGGAFVLLLVALGFAMVRSVGDAPVVEASPGCNGSLVLCDRTLDQVVVAATHNSMSSAQDGYLSANHQRGIVEQLDAGYRGLLIDTKYGLENDDGFVVTDRAPAEGADRQDLVEEIGEPAVAAAEALRDREDARGSERGLFLCHGLCEAGSTPLDEALDEIKDWMDDHPREVIVMFIEDEITPADTETAFEAAGLADLTLEQDLDEPFPTLEEMIDRDERLFVMAENDSAGVNWYHDGFAFTQETPFSFRTVSDFVCTPNRGDPDSPLFLVNHFITPPLATAGAAANAADVLGERLAECQDERGLLPNLVAVDFFASGDVIDVVNDLNR